MSLPARTVPIVNVDDRTGLASRAWFDFLSGLDGNSVFRYMTAAQVADLENDTPTLDVTASFQAAYDAAPVGSEIIVPAFDYACGTVTGTKHVIWRAHGATFNGAVDGVLALPGDVFTTSGGNTVISRQTTQNDDIGPLLIRRIVQNTGGTVAFTPSALHVYMEISGASDNFNWSTLMEAHNRSTGVGQNVAYYGIGYSDIVGASQTWGGLSEVKDTTGAAGNAIVAHEFDVSANGLVTGTYGVNPQRLALDIWIRKHNSAGAAVNADYAIRTNTEAGAYWKAGWRVEGNYTYGIDFSGATITAPTINLKATQSINFNNASGRQIYYDTAGLTYEVSGTKKSRLLDDGSIDLFGLRTSISGNFSTGATLPVFTANKPGATTAIAQWMDLTIDGVAYVFPVWAKA